MQPATHTPVDPVSIRPAPTCDDCYFRRAAVCALALDRPCPTFRPATTVVVTTAAPLRPPRWPAVATGAAA